MRNVRLSVLTAVAVISVGALIGCHDEPSATLAPESANSVAPFADPSRPILLENPYDGHPDFPPLTGSCAHEVNNEVAFSGWYTEGSGQTVVQRWDRNGNATAAVHGTSSATWPLDMNDRGQVLARQGGMDPENEPAWLYIWNADGSSSSPLPTGWVEPQSPVRMNRLGVAMATYIDVTWADAPPFRPMHYIVTSNFGTLVPPIDPGNRLPYNTPEAECLGEAIDDLGRVYGRCSIEGQTVHYRWTAKDNSTPIPGARKALADVAIHDVNRYGEIVGGSPSGIVYWSPAVGRIDIPVPADVPQLQPVAINDRGVVLLSSDYWEAEMAISAKAVAYWTRERGLVLLPRGGWSLVAVRDINNQGVIAGCVGRNAMEFQAAYWRTN